MITNQIVYVLITPSTHQPEHAITRTEYTQARRMIRDNGRYALRWMSDEVFSVMDQLCTIQDQTDRLAERADIVAYCKRENIECNVRHTA